MNKIIGIFAILSIAIAASMLLTPLVTAMPVIKRPYDMVEATIEGGSPQTVDYSYAYDTASGEIIFNTMDTLVMFNAEHDDSYIGSVATSWTSISLGAGVNSGIPITGLNFETPANQTGPNAKYYWRYDFKIHGADPATGITSILFQPIPAGCPTYSRNMTLADIAYSFQRTMVQDRYSGPEWMLDEPLLDNAAGDWIGLGGIADLTDQVQVNELGRLIENAVQYNTTDVWFNVMYPGAYAPFIQILCQTWASITSKAWENTYVIGTLGRSDWSGDWSLKHTGFSLDHTGWIDNRVAGKAQLSPLDVPYPVAYGSGPYILTPHTPDYVSNYFALTRFVDYFRGWNNGVVGYGGDFPKMAGASPAGYVNSIEVTWNYVWGTRKTMFLSGDCDFVAVPDPSYYGELYTGGNPSGTPLAGVRVIKPLAELVGDACFFTFDISPSAISGTIGTADTFNVNNIPPDFFGNPVWGIYVRKAFAQAFDYGTYLSTVFLGEAMQPATAIVPGITYYDPTVAAWTYNLAAANASFNLAGPDVNGKYLKNVGFTITIAYNNGNTARMKAAQLLQSGIESLNSKYTVNVIGIDWGSYLTAAETATIPCFIIGWLVDFPDAHDWALPFYDTYGSFCAWTLYSNPVMDNLINEGIATPDGPARQAIYTAIQNLAMSDCPSFMLDQPTGRHFERDWVVGYYYSPIYPGAYYYNRWKWYYVPLSSLSTPALPFSNYLPFDVNYDGVIDMKDIGTAAASFLATYANAPSVVPFWVFRADVNNDRGIDMFDIGSIAAHFLETGPTWSPTGFSVSLSPSSETVAPGQTASVTATVTGATGTVNYSFYVNGTLKQGPSTTSTYSFVVPALANASEADFRLVQVTATDSASPTPNTGSSTPTGVTSFTFNVDITPHHKTVKLGSFSHGYTAYSLIPSDDNPIIGGTSPYTYQWYVNGTAVPTETGPTFLFTPTAYGIYGVKCTITDSSSPAVALTTFEAITNCTTTYGP